MNEIFYNVTVSLDPSIEQDWLQWMKQTHIPDVLSTGLFLQSKILRIHGFEENGVTYAIQYRLASMDLLNKYQAEFAPSLQADHINRYGEKAIAFRTVLEIIEEF
jgi:Domain of unknown function (DUF4286)